MRKLAANTVYKGRLTPVLTLVRLNPKHHKTARRSNVSLESDFEALHDQQSFPSSPLAIILFTNRAGKP
jgi:hypothetical protein